MHGPELVGWLLVAVCGGAGAYCLLAGRGAPAGGARGTEPDGAMGLGMAAMAVPAGPGGPGAFAAVLAACFAAFFSAVAVFSLLPPGRAAHRGHHVVESLAMVYMALVMAAAPGGETGHGGHAPGGVPPLTGALLAYFALHALGTVPRLVPAGHGLRESRGAPEVAAACRLALSVAMFAMLVTV